MNSEMMINVKVRDRNNAVLSATLALRVRAASSIAKVKIVPASKKIALARRMSCSGSVCPSWTPNQGIRVAV